MESGNLALFEVRPAGCTCHVSQFLTVMLEHPPTPPELPFPIEVFREVIHLLPLPDQKSLALTCRFVRGLTIHFMYRHLRYTKGTINKVRSILQARDDIKQVIRFVFPAFSYPISKFILTGNLTCMLPMSADQRVKFHSPLSARTTRLLFSNFCDLCLAYNPLNFASFTITFQYSLCPS